ncbi:PrpF protein [Xylariales sp. PMI_506]|nr:PrpF protein [Xylariales sp. PMI_506]
MVSPLVSRLTTTALLLRPLRRDTFLRPALPKSFTSGKAMERSFPALFVRGGTSNGLVIRRSDLPPEEEWHKVLPAAMGSPDPYGRQLNGMGGGLSSLSKICVISQSARPDADIDFTFVQVGITDGELDMAGNCGNMSSAVGPMGWDLGLVGETVVNDVNAPGKEHHNEALVRIYNTNTSKVIHSRFKVTGDPPRYCPDGGYEMEGVSGTQSRITLRFQNPAGAKTGKALPTGNAIDVLRLPDGSEVRASLVDVSNPGVFVSLADLALEGLPQERPWETLNPALLEARPEWKSRLEAIRRAGAARMGLDPNVQSVPKVVVLFPGSGSTKISIRCLALSMGQTHKAVPLTLALCLGAAVGIPGSVAHELAVAQEDGRASVVIGHPSGSVEVGTDVRDGEIVSAVLHRTARLLMKGMVYY